MYYDCILAGGGMAGLTMALALQQAGVRALLLDTRPASLPENAGKSFDGRTTALNADSVETLTRYGLWEHLAPLAAPINHIAISEPPFRSVCRFRHDEGNTVQPMGWIVRNSDYTRHARQRLQEVPVETGVQVAGVESRDGLATITVADGRQWQTPLLVAADGRHSPVRSLSGIRIRRKDYGQTALTGLVAHEQAHGDTAFELFLPDGPLALLPMPGGHVSCFVWTLPTAIAASINSLPDALFAAALAERCAHVSGAMRLDSPRFAYPLAAYRAERLIALHTALVADAGHFLHPLAGQGFNVGLRDIRLLVQHITSRLSPGLLPGDRDGLEAYEQARLPDIHTMFLATDTLNRLFLGKLPGLAAARRGGLQVVDKVAPLRRRFTAYAMGRGRLAGLNGRDVIPLPVTQKMLHG